MDVPDPGPGHDRTHDRTPDDAASDAAPAPPRRSRAAQRSEASEQTRADLLDAGAALLREQPVGAVLSQVKAPVVARRAGRTIGAFYHHWESQDAYLRDLVAHVLDPASIPSTGEAADQIVAGLRAGVPAEEMLRLAAVQLFASLRADPYVPVYHAVWATHRSDDRVAALLRQVYGTVSAELLPVYQALLAAQGRRLRAPFTLHDVAVGMIALAQGMSMRVAVAPGDVPVAPAGALPGPDDRDLFADLTAALLEAMSEPAG